jgi:pimeloyl-ACP methyl ester carboxylesterase
MPLLSFPQGNIFYEHVQQFPNRPTLIFLHDSLGCTELWRDFPASISTKTHCNFVIYDRFGYGKSDPFLSEKRENAYMELEADFLNQFIEKLNLENCILFGHSDGGSIALIAASKYPEKISAVFTEGAHIFVEDITLEGIRKAKETYRTTDLKHKLEKYHGDKTQALFDAWTETWLRPDFRDWNIEHFLPAIKCPTFVFQGVDDEFGSIDQVEGIEKGCSDAKFFIIPNAKHTPHKEARELTETIVCHLISELSKTITNL